MVILQFMQHLILSGLLQETDNLLFFMFLSSLLTAFKNINNKIIGNA